MLVLADKWKLHGFLQKYRGDIFILAILALFFTFLFRDALFGGRFILIGDPLRQLYPLRMVAWGMIREGTLPVWTPLIFSGYPLLSMVMLGIGYPLTWGYLFLPGYWAEQIYILTPYLLSSIFTYAYLREVGRSRIASLLGGLVYGYGGYILSPIGLTGVHAHSATWLPLILIGIERAQRKPFLSCLLLSTVAYTMSVLAGSGQIFVYVGILSLAYGIYLGIFPNNAGGLESVSWFGWRRWRPLAVISGAMILSAGLAAFQILETWASVKMSVRRVYPYESFSEGSFPLGFAWRSFLQPLGNYYDSSPYTPLLAVCLAVVALVSASLRPRLRPQVFFWVIAAGLACVLILGNNTPIYRYYYSLPFVNRFRFPSRHSMEWTFAIGVLAAYGWDVMEVMISRLVKERRPYWLWPKDIPNILTAGVFLLISGMIGYYWFSYTVKAGLNVVSALGIAVKGLNYPYLGWKGGFTLAVIISLLPICRVINSKMRMVLLAATLALYCLVEPYIWLINPIVSPMSVTAEQIDSFGESTRFLQTQLNEQCRNYSLINPYSITFDPKRGDDGVNWTALAGIQNLNGYESLIMDRYIRALRNVSWDTASTEQFIILDLSLLDSNSHVLDLLNTCFVTSYSNLSFLPASEPTYRSSLPIPKDGIEFSIYDMATNLRGDKPTSLNGGAAEADTLALVTTMANSGGIENETPVAKISIHTSDGRVIERLLRAGIDTSEWSYDHPSVKPKLLHALAPIYDSAQGDGFRSYRFFARIGLGERVRVERIEVVKLTNSATVGLWKASLYDSVTHRSTILPEPPSDRWQKVYDKNGVAILKNLRVLPRAWLVTKAEAHDKVEIRRRIRGESDIPFDPLATALVEIEPHKLPALSGAPLSADSYARIVTYEPGRLVIETNSNQQAMLVVSEMHYPGWGATLDGVKTSIHQTDFLLRGVFVPAGKHNIEMIYNAPGARKGAMISLATILLISALAVYARVPYRLRAR
jgi:hypothetical protein